MAVKTIDRHLFITVTVAVVCLFASQGCQSDSPGIAGAQLLEERCATCHKIEIPKNARKSRAEWEKTVSRMIERGAKLSPEEKRALVRYLARVYKP